MPVSGNIEGENFMRATDDEMGLICGIDSRIDEIATIMRKLDIEGLFLDKAEVLRLISIAHAKADLLREDWGKLVDGKS